MESYLLEAAVSRMFLPESKIDPKSSAPIAIVPIHVEAQTGCCIAVSYHFPFPMKSMSESVTEHGGLYCSTVPRIIAETHSELVGALTQTWNQKLK